MTTEDARSKFRALHEQGTFLMPNPHDVGSCRLLASLGFEALATTSGGFAASLGRLDMSTTRDELGQHVSNLCVATELPVSVDAEQCFPTSPGGISVTVEMLAEAGAAGCSIEDWDPDEQRITELSLAVDRVQIAAQVAERAGLVLTARAENHLRGRDDLDDTIERLAAFRAAGAHVVYAPGLRDISAIARVTQEVGGPVNVLLVPGGPSRDQLSAVGVRRLSVGSTFAQHAYGALVDAANHLLATGHLDAAAPRLSRELATSAFS